MQLNLYRYNNPEDSNLGSQVIVIADSLENAIPLITAELKEMDYQYQEGLVTIEPIENVMVVDSFSGDCYF